MYVEDKVDTVHLLKKELLIAMYLLLQMEEPGKVNQVNSRQRKPSLSPRSMLIFANRALKSYTFSSTSFMVLLLPLVSERGGDLSSRMVPMLS